jgi:hypothetical protein
MGGDNSSYAPPECKTLDGFSKLVVDFRYNGITV